MLSCDHLSAFIKLFSVFLRDRDATCRLRALTCLGADFKWILFCRQDSLIDLLSLISRRCLDRSKSIRIKAMQSLAGLFSETNKTTITPDRRRVNMMDIGSEVISIAFKLLALSPDSMYYCNDTIEAAGNFLCSTALRGQAMHEHLKSSLDYSYGAFSQKIFSDVIHFHLVGYKEWSEFSATASDATLLKLINFLSMEPDQERLHKKKYQGVLKEAFNALETSRRQKELAACILIAVFSPLTSYNVGNEWNLLLDTIQESVAGTTPCEADQISKTRLIKWSLKALAAVVRNRKTHKNKQVKLLLERHYVSLNEADADSAIECLYSLNNTFEIVKSVLHVYEIQLQILDRSHPLKLLRNYIIFIGNISRNYDLACDAFIQRLRDAQASLAREYVTAEFDYLQQEEQKLQEEDAVLRFSNMLLDGDSVPGCYVPFLQQLSTSETLHTSLRTAAITSLGKYLFASARLANENKHLLEGLMQSTHIPVKLAALDLIQKLILAFPNDFLCMLSRVILTLQDEEVKEAAYCICARLLLEQKLKPDVLLGPICDGLCETNVKIRTVLIFVLKKLLEDAGRSKHQLILSLYKYGASAQARQKLVEVLVEEVLDAADLQSDELASSVVHALTLGQHDATFLASFLNPSSKVLAALEINLTTCPPRIFLQGNPEATSNLIKFVNNHKRQSSRHAASDRQLVARLLELLQNKASMRKRKSQDKAASLAISLENIKDYEHAVEDFKNCRIGNSLWEMMKSDI
ncbi:hypothetical protein O6H91_12G031500 [Diphasiastrum complanatum]|uniref:Uncharacterized protein n=1 Tax=Diphasiastrum complanatum TaxID=34168 RepID=A0ACC2C054_DIPCM|nr:hypothetical protein O6H91_12G031500 [Diphasiastrum complanatum]